MATIFRVRKNANDTRSGGKIMRGRRVPDVPTPYSRSTPSSSSAAASQSPNRFFGFISPASRVITGAAKMISTVFFPDSPSSSSDDDINDDISSQGDDELNQNEETPEAKTNVEKTLQLTVRKNDIKLAIEQLLMQETYSRDECNNLVKIIESRVVEFPAIKEGGTSITLSGGHVPDICNTAVMEARKWAKEKKTREYLQSDKSQGTFTSNSCLLSNVTEEEQGSPVLMAKSYMKSRPPWASPTAGQVGFRTSSPVAILLKEETPHSIGSHALPSSKDLRRNNFGVESMNSLDGSRRVRFKSAETDERFSTLDNLQKDDNASVEAEKRDKELGVRIRCLDPLPMTGPVEQSAHSPADLHNGFSVHDGPGHEPLKTSASMLISDHNQDLEGAEITEEGGAIHVAESQLPDTHDGRPDQSAVTANSNLRCTPSQDIKPVMQSDSNDLPGVNGIDGPSQPKGIEVMESSQRHQFFDDTLNGSNDMVVANGFSPASSLSARVNAESSQRLSNNVGRNLITSGDSKLEGSCELLSEASVDVPINNEFSNIVSGSLHSYSRLSKEGMDTGTQSVSSPGMKRRSSPRIEKQILKKYGKISKRGGRGRGK